MWPRVWPLPVAFLDRRQLAQDILNIPRLQRVQHSRLGAFLIVRSLGCELCIGPGPVDCIVMLPDTALSGAARGPIDAIEATHFLARFETHQARDERRKREEADKIEAKREDLKQQTGASTLADAIARAKARRLAGDPVR